MSDGCVGSVATPIGGAQPNFIGGRKRAMWRADKRIPDDLRVMEWRHRRAFCRCADALAFDLYSRTHECGIPLIGLAAWLPESYFGTKDSPTA